MSVVGDLMPRLHEIMPALPQPTALCVDPGVDVPHVLAGLGRVCPGPLTPTQLCDLTVICRKIAVTGTLWARYEADWKTPASKTPLTDEQWRAALSILAAWSDALGEDPQQRGLSLKLLNAVLAAMDARPADETLRHWSRQRLAEIEVPCAGIESALSRPTTPHATHTLPLTVLAYEGPCLRAYLAMMRRAGLRPQRIVLIVLSQDPSSHKPVGRWFPGRLRTWYAEKAQDLRLNYWPRHIGKSHPQFVSGIANRLQNSIDRPAALIQEMYGPPRYETYCDCVERVVAPQLNDDAVVEALRSMAPGNVLFTGGGIMPSRIVDLPGLRFLHVHPGRLPDVRGADGLLWSTLVQGRPAVSCFHMNAGLDTGEVIATREYPAMTVSCATGSLPASVDRKTTNAGTGRQAASGTSLPDDQMLYRAVFGFIDPLLRADLLVNQVLATADEPSRLQATPQDANEGVTYHFMHPALRHRVLAALFT